MCWVKNSRSRIRLTLFFCPDGIGIGELLMKGHQVAIKLNKVIFLKSIGNLGDVLGKQLLQFAVVDVARGDQK